MAEKGKDGFVLNDHMHHVIPQRELIMTGAKLFVLMALTVVVAMLPYWLPWWEENVPVLFNNIVAVGIATIKAILVIQIFMGVKFGTKLTKVFAYGGFIWLILMLIAFIDYWSRPWEPVPGWETDVPSALPRNPEGDPISGRTTSEPRNVFVTPEE
jgi:cytochrome c oxidase subunit 4